MTEEKTLIDINQASVDELDSLPGIGASLAQRIIEFREDVHPFEEVIELTAVPGISERLVRSFEDLITVNLPAAEMSSADDLEEPPAEPPTAVEEVTEAESAAEAVLPNGATAEDTDLPEEPEGEAEEAPLTPIMDAIELAEEEETEPSPADAKPEEAEPAAPVIARMSEPAGPPAAPAAAANQNQARRRGCVATLLGALIGAVMGAAIALAIIAALNNGSLSFADSDARLQREMSSAQQAQIDLNDQLTSLNENLSYLATREGAMALQQQESDQALTNVEQSVSTIQRNVAALEAMDAELDQRITAVSAAAETFDRFLNGLRDLLLDLQGPPTETPTPVETATELPASPTASSAEGAAAEPTATPTAAGNVTRTPRPTATPFSLPTSTPEPQP